MSNHLLLAPALPAHRVHAIKSPASSALDFIRQSHYTSGGKEFWGIVVVVAVLFVLALAARAVRVVRST